MGVSERLGSISEGKMASLVLLRKNPMETISNARSIEAVFLAGRYYDRDAPDKMTEEARQIIAGKS